MSTNGIPPLGPEDSSASQQRARAEANERRDERVETVAIAISLVLIVGALVALIGAVLLSRVPPSRHAPAQWIPRTPTLMFSRPAHPADSPVSDDAARAAGPRLRTAGLSRLIAWFVDAISWLTISHIYPLMSATAAANSMFPVG